MKKISVEYGIDGRIIKLSDNAVHYEQENLTLHIDATIPTDKNVRGYIKAPNGNSNVTGALAKIDGVYTLTVEDTFMAKGTLYVGFEAYDNNGCVERYEPLKVYVDGFVTLDGGNADNVYAVTVEVAEVETLPPDEDAYVENVGTKKDVKLKIGIPRGAKGNDGQDGYTPIKGTDYYTDEEAEAFALDVQNKYADSMNNKVDKVEGKGLSTNDFTDLDKAKLESAVIQTSNIDTAVIPTSTNLIQNKPVAGTFAVLEQKCASMDNFKIDLPNAEVSYLFNGVYSCSLKDTKAREMINNLPMQKIFEVTTTEDVDSITIDSDMLGQGFKLDDVFIYFKMPTAVDTSTNWSCYANDVTGSVDCLYYFTPSTTTKYVVFRGQRMCEGMWHTQRAHGSAAYNNNFQTSYQMSNVNYISKLTIRCDGLPAGSTITVCGRKVVE